MTEEEYLEEIFDLVLWNLSFNISVKETLESVNRLDLLEFFEKDIEEDSCSERKRKRIE